MIFLFHFEFHLCDATIIYQDSAAKIEYLVRRCERIFGFGYSIGSVLLQLYLDRIRLELVYYRSCVARTAFL